VPLAVEAGDTVPHGPIGHANDQLTPLPVASLLTVAVKLAVPAAPTVAEVCDSDTLTRGGGGPEDDELPPPPQPPKRLRDASEQTNAMIAVACAQRERQSDPRSRLEALASGWFAAVKLDRRVRMIRNIQALMGGLYGIASAWILEAGR